MPKKILTVEAINQRLDGSGVRVEQRGGKLYLRATLPLKTGHGRQQQRIALGVNPIPEGLEYAEARAWELAGQKARNAFRWEEWAECPPRPKFEMSVGDLLPLFRKEFEAQGLIKNEKAWKRQWWHYFKWLPQDQSLSKDAVVNLVTRYEPNSYSRRHCCQQLAKLLDFAGVQIDLAKYRGNWSGSKTKARKLPTDEQIIQVYKSFEAAYGIPHYVRQWQWVYGVIAAYGLRDHEALLCEIEAEPPYKCRVLRGKTGPREVYPFFPEWVEQWRLWEMRGPKVSIVARILRGEADHQDLGERISKALTRYIKQSPCPHQIYDLRHAYVLRASVRFNVPGRVVAAYCGHSFEMHMRVYTKYLSKLDAQSIYEEAISKVGRPKPPTL